jgi:hypothetical protein
MKIKIPLVMVLLVLLMSIQACNKENDADTALVVVKELPIMYGGCTLADGESVVINSEVVLNETFSADFINNTTELQNIDFIKYTVLAGASTYSRGVASLEHLFSRNKSTSYKYQLKVHYQEFCFKNTLLNNS